MGHFFPKLFSIPGVICDLAQVIKLCDGYRDHGGKTHVVEMLFRKKIRIKTKYFRLRLTDEVSSERPKGDLRKKDED